MLAVNYSTYRNNLKEYCDRATDDNETIIVTRKGEKNVVIMSLDEYNNIMENLKI
ncbi:MAG: type II toxin-antitoxin system Phd/YefM family antitoxin, partial [Desulfosporosinus sp.]|nr:type II toxin-antitoxin system Phd/YefM family antitoxin [Desulfosporosinus sp.]